MTGETITRTAGQSDPDSPRLRPCLFQVIHCARPLGPSFRYALTAVREVELRRGSAQLRHDRERDALLIALDDGRVSSRHARLVRASGGFEIIDEGSKNGSFVNGARVTRQRLREGDVVELGDTFFLYREAVMMTDADAAVLDSRHAEVRGTGLFTLVPELTRQYASLAEVARTAESIVVLGETGTGKELVARAIHTCSGRRGKLVAVNCAALPAPLVESELFGHRKGAFSGAIADRDGLISAADGGTLFLDEIGDLPLPAQAALLRALQEREVRPVGANTPTMVDFRLVAATHRDLSAMIAAGQFRDDLYARLRAFTVRLPPLRQRREDLGILTAALLHRVADATTKPVRLDYGAARALFAYSWPHNVRELENCLTTALALARGSTVHVGHLPQEVARAGLSPDGAAVNAARGASDDELAARLRNALETHQGNVSAVARALRTTRMQVHRWAKRFGIELGIRR